MFYGALMVGYVLWYQYVADPMLVVITYIENSYFRIRKCPMVSMYLYMKLDDCAVLSLITGYVDCIIDLKHRKCVNYITHGVRICNFFHSYW